MWKVKKDGGFCGSIHFEIPYIEKVVLGRMPVVGQLCSVYNPNKSTHFDKIWYLSVFWPQKGAHSKLISHLLKMCTIFIKCIIIGWYLWLL